jgi:hypothetical protein
VSEQELTYVSAEELLSAAKDAQPHVDINLGGAYMRCRLAPTYDDMQELERRRAALVTEIRAETCAAALRRFRELSDEAISAAGLIAYTAERPALTIEQALDLMQDGLTVRVIMSAFQKAGTAHLMKVAHARLAQGKAG